MSIMRFMATSALLLRTAGAFEATAIRSRPLRSRFSPERCLAAAATEEKVQAAEVKSEPIVLPTNENERLLKIRHSAAHVMAIAVQRLFPGTKVSIGPWIEKGYYYDFDPPEPFQEKDLRRIKKEMDKLIQMKLPFTQESVSREEAKRRIEEQDEPYKMQILDRIEGDDITIWHTSRNQDGWWDLCAGPHVGTTADLPKDAIALESIAGAYLFGDEKGPMLQRIYATAWETKEQLAEHQRLQEEAKRRDHRAIGKQMDLFSIQQKAGGGLVFWHPKGATMRNIMETYWKEEHINGGYELLYTPHMASVDLWKTSGHFDFYKDDMFDQMQVEDQEYQIKPMNCPFHVLTFKDGAKSYRDLPKRWAEMGTVYRYEKSGALNGLFRVRGFTQDDAHIFCLPEQLTGEIQGVLDLTERILSKFGFTDYEIMLSTRPEKAIGTDEIWNLATDSLVDALKRKGWEYGIDEGGGAFYGPKIDIKIKDAIGRLWQCSTIQCDFNLPERFELEYTSDDGSKKRPIMLHRAIYGSVERFFGVLIESTAGDFPFWIAPVQVRLLPVSDDFRPYCEEVQAAAKAAGIRMEIDQGGRSVGKQIKVANNDKVPLYAVIGEKEVAAKSLSFMCRKEGTLLDLGEIPYAAAVATMAEASKSGASAVDEYLGSE